MGEPFIDDLAKALRHGAVSRQRALRLLGAAVVAAAVSPLAPRRAGAGRAPECFCQMRAEDRAGFCGFGIPAVQRCTSDAECPAGRSCVVHTGCKGSTPCVTSNDCTGNYTCIDGACNQTGCAAPCTA
jgi:hypothetical protein